MQIIKYGSMPYKKGIVFLAGIVLLSFISCSKKEIKENIRPPVNVVAVEVKVQRIENRISLVGSLSADESVEIKNEMAGIIEKIEFKEGQKIKKGDRLLLINAEKLNAALSQTKVSLKLAQTTYDRLVSLIKAGAISQQEFDQAQSTLDSKKADIALINAQIKESVITASFDGVLGERYVSEGQFINEGTRLTYLVKEDPMKVEVNIPERFLGHLNIGQSIELKVATYPEDTFTGTVYFIAPQVNEQTRTVLVKAKLPNPLGKLHSGMFASLELTLNVRPNALVVPETAIIPKGDEVHVFIIDNENKAQMKTVKSGLRVDGIIEITDGLSADDIVIVEGYQKIGPGSSVVIKPVDQNETP